MKDSMAVRSSVRPVIPVTPLDVARSNARTRTWRGKRADGGDGGGVVSESVLKEVEGVRGDADRSAEDAVRRGAENPSDTCHRLGEEKQHILRRGEIELSVLERRTRLDGVRLRTVNTMGGMFSLLPSPSRKEVVVLGRLGSGLGSGVGRATPSSQVGLVVGSASHELWVWVRLPKTLLRVERGVAGMMGDPQRYTSDV